METNLVDKVAAGARIKRRWIIGGCSALLSIFLLLAGGAGWMLLDSRSPLNKASAIATTKQWARIAELPATKSDLRVEVRGSMFTRQFRISFRDTPGNIRNWISASPGPSSVKPSADEEGWLIYEYPAGGGAISAEIRVSPEGNEVRIDTSWS